MATYKPYKKTESGKEEIKIPYSVLSNPPTIPTKASDVNALSLDGGTINKSKTIKMDASTNSDGANLKWGTVNSKNPYIGYASDQVDGTFVVGSLLGTNYASGLAIGGGSGNLLWKGTKVATINDIPTNYVKYTAQTLTDAQKSQARSNIGAGTSNFDGTWGSLSGKPNVVQSTGNSTSDVMSQKAVTDELNKKANSADLATVATSGNYNDLLNKPTIPAAANNGTLTIQKNGTNVATFGANQSTNTTANITVPTKVSELTNDSGFITSAPANYTSSARTPSQCTANGFWYVRSSTNSLTDAEGNPFLQYHTSNDDFRILATAWSDMWVQQIATDFRSTHIYYRIRNGGTWEAWTEIAKISDIPTFSLDGTTLTITTN